MFYYLCHASPSNMLLATLAGKAFMGAKRILDRQKEKRKLARNKNALSAATKMHCMNGETLL